MAVSSFAQNLKPVYYAGPKPSWRLWATAFCLMPDKRVKHSMRERQLKATSQFGKSAIFSVTSTMDQNTFTFSFKFPSPPESPTPNPGNRSPDNVAGSSTAPNVTPTSAHAEAQARYRARNAEKEKAKARVRMRKGRLGLKYTSADLKALTSAELRASKTFAVFREYVNNYMLWLVVDPEDADAVAGYERLLECRPAAGHTLADEDVEFIFRHVEPEPLRKLPLTRVPEPQVRQPPSSSGSERVNVWQSTVLPSRRWPLTFRRNLGIGLGHHEPGIANNTGFSCFKRNEPAASGNIIRLPVLPKPSQSL
ncbi:hypothetical protein C8F04DRAFT_1182333 [Mycena alexandri]|uniref:Uncharacterized protein n=1 Tax=Mycena alexandri TaxID=1745969 RepID=A0AAD6SYJ3_9AGAR|nr:hypothetical protein C8F04DRAFT_1182333 [Mycena alexandri]